MNSLPEFLAGTHLPDIALGALVAEGVVLVLYHRRSGRGLPVMDLLSVLLPGAFLLLALRSALVGNAGAQVSLLLVAALLAHIADLWRRWRQRVQPAAAVGRQGPEAAGS